MYVFRSFIVHTLTIILTEWKIIRKAKMLISIPFWLPQTLRISPSFVTSFFSPSFLSLYTDLPLDCSLPQLASLVMLSSPSSLFHSFRPSLRFIDRGSRSVYCWALHSFSFCGRAQGEGVGTIADWVISILSKRATILLKRNYSCVGEVGRNFC